MDNQNQKQRTAAEQARAERKKRAAIQRYIRIAAIAIAIAFSLASLLVSCSTRKAVQEVAAQLAAKKAAQAAQAELAAQQEAEQAEAEDSGTRITMSFIGDITLCSDSYDTADDFEAVYAANGSSYFFENVRSIFEGDDLTVANLECSLTAGTEVASLSAMLFRADPSYVSILNNSGIDAVSTANDHTSDFGSSGFVDTLATMDVAGITRFGENYTAMVEVKGVQVGLFSLNLLVSYDAGVDYAADAAELISSLEEDGAQIIICMLHWGDRYDEEVDDSYVELAHSVVDSGADLVVGTHPRSLQGIELYNGKYIVYSPGAFLYGGETELTETDSIIFQQTFCVRDGEVQDNADYEIIPCTPSSTGTTNSYVPDIYGESDAERVLTKIYALSADLDYGISRPSQAAATTTTAEADNTASDAAAVTADDSTGDDSGAVTTETDDTSADTADGD